MDKDTDDPQVTKLQRSLYGLAQTPNLWYGTIDKSPLEVGFTATKLGLFTRTAAATASPSSRFTWTTYFSPGGTPPC